MRGGNAYDRTGKRYGRLVVVARAGSDPKSGNSMWECECDCGNVVVKRSAFLNKGYVRCSKSCIYSPHYKHGGTTHSTRTKEYAAWSDIKRRCFNTKSPNYHRYGGRGVTMCASWVEDFEAFLTHIGPAPKGSRISVERIDNSGNYEPGNVKWATPAEQMSNRENTIRVTFRGKERTLREIADIGGKKYTQVYYRFRLGDTGEDLIK
jgi:hypothetical protein